MRRRSFILLCAAILTSAPGVAQEVYGPVENPGEGNAMVREFLTRMPPENTSILGLLKIRPAEGPLREIPVKLSVRVTSEHSWDDIYESQPTAKQPGELLIIRHRGNQPNEYLYTRINSKDQAPRPGPLDRKEVFQPFAGSDFFIGDLGLEFFHWPTQRLIKKEMRKGRSCRVIESINPTKDGAYSRVLSWLDFETGNIIMAEGYDRAGRVLKEFSIRKVSRSEGRAQLKEMEIRNDQSDSRTRLEFNLEVEEK